VTADILQTEALVVAGNILNMDLTDLSPFCIPYVFIRI
jgi:hypothetical protein